MKLIVAMVALLISAQAVLAAPASRPSTQQSLSPKVMQAAEQAVAASGEETTLVALTELAKGPGAWDRMKGLFTFVNIVGVTAGAFLVIAIVWLTKLYLIQLFVHLPDGIKQLLAYAASFAVIASASTAKPEFQLFFLIPGCLGLAASIFYTAFLYWGVKGVFPHPMFFVMSLAWGVVAVYFRSETIGFMSVLAFMVGIGFSTMLWPGVVALGFEDDDALGRSMLAGLILLVVAVLAAAFPASVPPIYTIFNKGFLFLGTFVFFLALLIVSSKHYDTDRYFLHQGMTIIAGIAALFFGSVLGLGLLTGIGGTFFYLYILEKYYEIPWEGKGWAWSCLGLAGLLYCFAVFARNHPQYFLW